MSNLHRLLARIHRQPPPAPTSAPALEEALRVLGFRVGFPPFLPDRIRAIDHETTALMACGSCGYPHLECRPWHRGNDYRIVAECLNCGAGEEV
jgi:hypothetical protein